MARTVKPKDYFEPWTATKSKLWESGFKSGPPRSAQSPEELAEQVSRWESDRDRAGRNAEWLVWGSRMVKPEICVSPTGTVSVPSDQAIILEVAKRGVVDDGPVTHEEVARRVAACVTACAGIVDPQKFIDDARALLLAYCRGECEDPRSDPRAVGLLGRCIPPDELKEFDDGES